MPSLAKQLTSGDRRALAKAITLIESTKSEDREDAVRLLNQLMPATGQSIRIGLSGTPGVGKSTFIEAMGMRLINAGYKVCVLTIDPSSRITGGSILGDKTRMQTLAKHPNAYIRPSPSGQTLGGVARRTREVMFACEAAGFDIVLIETVGVGQSETAVAEMTDIFLLLLQPAAGDELQGIKRGIMELADIIAINKADGKLVSAANDTAQSMLQATRYLKRRHPEWDIPVIPCSSTSHNGLDQIESSIFEFVELIKANGQFKLQRKAQSLHALEEEISAQLLQQLHTHVHYPEKLKALQKGVKDYSITPASAAQQLIESLLQTKP